MANVIYTSREEIEVYRFSPWATIGIPLAALFLQSFLPVHIHFFEIFDLPLLVTIFFAVARRSQVGGVLTGWIIGIAQDALSTKVLGLYGIAKTIVGFIASSIGAKIDVENPGSRLIMTFVFYLVHQVVYFLVARGMVRMTIEWRWGHTLGAALANGLLAVVLFAILDKTKQRA